LEGFFGKDNVAKNYSNFHAWFLVEATGEKIDEFREAYIHGGFNLGDAEVLFPC